MLSEELQTVRVCSLVVNQQFKINVAVNDPIAVNPDLTKTVGTCQ
jgi:hypothetical protein